MARVSRGAVAAGALSTTLALAACNDGEGPTTGGSTGPAGGSTIGITTFEFSTSGIDPSDPTLTGSTTQAATDDDTSITAGTTDDPSTGSSGSSDGSSGGDAAPMVQSTTPGDLESGIPADATISISFSEAMDPATLTTTTVGDACAGSVQVSSDDFTTCVTMTAAPATADDVTFDVTPTAALGSSTTYRVRVLATVTDAGGTPMDADFATGTGFIVRYFHSITIDGVDDFDVGETLPTSTAGHTARVAWDDSYVYLGMDSPDVAANDDQIWLVAYVGGPMGSTQGVTYNTQLPLLPFDARWHLRWRTDDAFAGGLEWTGASWENAAFAIGGEDVATSGTFVELRVSRADIGAPAYLDLHMGLLREEPFNEASWAAVPGGSYVDGYDPDYGQFFQLDLAGSTAPADTPPM